MPDSDDSSSVASSSSSSSEEDRREKQEQEGQAPASKKARLSSSGPSTAPPLEIAPPVPVSSSSSSSSTNKQQQQRQAKIIILLDQAKLETVKNRRGTYELLNCDDHRDLCKKKLHDKTDPREYRPDIAHQELLALIDSPLNKAGLLRVYIRTSQNVLIDVHPSIRIPRTYRRFSGLMVQLLHKMKIRASNSSATLMRVIKNPLSRHLPPGTRGMGLSCRGALYSPHALVNAFVPRDLVDINGNDDNNNDRPPICFVIGAMASGHVKMEDHPFIEQMVSISEYPLSGAAAASRLVGAIEHHWGIV